MNSTSKLQKKRQHKGRCWFHAGPHLWANEFRYVTTLKIMLIFAKNYIKNFQISIFIVVAWITNQTIYIFLEFAWFCVFKKQSPLPFLFQHKLFYLYVLLSSEGTAIISRIPFFLLKLTLLTI